MLHSSSRLKLYNEQVLLNKPNFLGFYLSSEAANGSVL